MALIKSIKGKSPTWRRGCFFADNASIIGDVCLGKECSVWFNTVIRGDVNFIRIGNRVNIQDGVVIHCTYKKASTSIGDDVSIGHNALIHGCTLKDNILIGMGAIVMDNSVVNSNSIIAAGAVVLENTVIEEGCLYAGVPAKKIKNLNKKDVENKIKQITKNYIEYKSWFKA